MLDWLEMIVRWLHVIAGIGWIGSSFYFIFLDASLRRGENDGQGIAGESWQVHGGGFYHMRKYSVAPAAMPAELHWFKYEAYTTWLSGFFLLGLIYYVGAGVYLVEAGVMDLTPTAAVAISVGSLAVGWLVYDRLCKSPLGKNDALLALIGFALLVAAAWGYTLVFSGRGAYVHAGVLVGTLMAANVFFVIIPNQKIVVADLIAGRAPDPDLGRRAKQRSLHNNYLTLPVVFVMISGHYPMTFASQWNWAILAGIFIVGGLARHFFNLKHAGGGSHYWLWIAAGLVMAIVIAISMQRPKPAEIAGITTLSSVHEIIQRRCASCHSVQPGFAGIESPPLEVILETPADILRLKDRINAQTIATSAMPPGNATGMTPEERAALAAWYRAEVSGD